jgi:hypothetical protein
MHVYYCDLWTWNGCYVLRSGDRYWEPDSAGWQKLIGGEPSARYGRPLLYRVPLLLAILIVVAVGCAAGKLVLGAGAVCKNCRQSRVEKSESLSAAVPPDLGDFF